MNKLGKAIVCAVAAVAVLAGCNAKTANNDSIETNRFIRINTIGGLQKYAAVYYDSCTGVEYIIALHGGICQITNADGTPRVYKEDNKND